MGTEAFADLHTIDASVLTPMVQQMVHQTPLSIQEWQVRQLAGGAGNPVSLGLYRISGTARNSNGSMNWSLILKIIQSPANVGFVNLGEGADPTHWNYWKREPLIYSSGLLETLPETITAPRCYGITDFPGDIIWLWLEDISDRFQGNWPLEQYALTARHLGQLNGVFLSESALPPVPWFSRHRLQQWLENIPWQTLPWEHPQVRARYPGLENNIFQHMLVENKLFLAKLERLPQTLCHGDTYPTNFMSRVLPNGQPQTVALDWALAGLAPVGADLGQLVFGAQIHLPEIDRLQVDQILFESYLKGLMDSGYTVDPDLVRFGYTAFAALQVGLFQVFLLGETLKQSPSAGEPALDRKDLPDCFEVVMAKEAYQLL